MYSKEYKNIETNKKLSDQEYLSLVFEYTKSVWKKLSRVDGDFEHIEIGNEDADDIFKYMVALNNFNKFPRIVSEKYFKILKSQKLYRGVPKISYAKNLIADENYHHGRGYTNGIFTVKNKQESLPYTVPFDLNKPFDSLLQKPENTFEIKLSECNKIPYFLLEYIAENIKSTSIMGLDGHLKEKVLNFLDFVMSIQDDAECLHFLEIFMHDLSKLALYLGYDCVTDGKYTIILNRGKIVISDTEFERIEKGTQEETLKQNLLQ